MDKRCWKNMLWGTRHTGEVKNLTPYMVSSSNSKNIGGMVHLWSELTKRYNPHLSLPKWVKKKSTFRLLDTMMGNPVSLGHKQLEENLWILSKMYSGFLPPGNHRQKDDRGAVIHYLLFEVYAPVKTPKKKTVQQQPLMKTLYLRWWLNSTGTTKIIVPYPLCWRYQKRSWRNREVWREKEGRNPQNHSENQWESRKGCYPGRSGWLSSVVQSSEVHLQLQQLKHPKQKLPGRSSQKLRPKVMIWRLLEGIGP